MQFSFFHWIALGSSFDVTWMKQCMRAITVTKNTVDAVWVSLIYPRHYAFDLIVQYLIL